MNRNLGAVEYNDWRIQQSFNSQLDWGEERTSEPEDRLFKVMSKKNKEKI